MKRMFIAFALFLLLGLLLEWLTVAKSVAAQAPPAPASELRPAHWRFASMKGTCSGNGEVIAGFLVKCTPDVSAPELRAPANGASGRAQ